MHPRQWLGVALVFGFLPTTTPIWYAASGGSEVTIPLGFAAVIHLLFLLGLILVEFPTKEILAAAGDLEPNESSHATRGNDEEE